MVLSNHILLIFLPHFISILDDLPHHIQIIILLILYGLTLRSDTPPPQRTQLLLPVWIIHPLLEQHILHDIRRLDLPLKR